MTKCVVIGSNAFSGQDFVDLLLEETDWQVIGVSRSPEPPDFMLRYKSNPALERFRFRRCDLNADLADLLAMLDRERPEYIVNFAAQSEVGPSWEHPEHWFATNTVALARLINHLRRCEYLSRYLHISSPEAYGSCVGTVTEDTPDNPSTPYAASKSAADMIVKVYQKQYGLPAVWVRATNVYGARQQLFKIVPRSAIYMKLDRKIRLDGGGVAVKSYIHVRDVSRAELAVLRGGRVGERYHVSPDAGVAVRDVVRTIAKFMGRRFADVTEIGAERPGQDAAYVIDSGKARRELGWRPQIGIEQGLQETIEWVNGNWPEISRQPLEYRHKV